MIRNCHRRSLPCSLEQAAPIIDNPTENFWPGGWPRMRLERGLTPGSPGGHGPIRYIVQEYIPGQKALFQFTAPRGFHGYHVLQVHAADSGSVLEHDLQMSATPWAWLQWQLVYRPLHDALLGDAMDKAAAPFGLPPRTRYSPYVRLLRRLMR